MDKRPSMLTQKQRAEWLRDADCPQCGEFNFPPMKLLIAIDYDGVATCGKCQYQWSPRLDREVQG